MKTQIQKLWLLALVTLIISVFCFKADAQIPPPNGGGGIDTAILAVQGQDQVRDLALRKVRQGSIYFSSPSIDADREGTRTGTSVIGKYSEDVSQQLSDFEYSITLKNPSDIITVRVYENDEYGNVLLFGQSQFKIEQNPNILLYTAGVPILNNIESAEIIPLNEDGSSGQSIPLGVTPQGQLFFQLWPAGSPNGLLVVKSIDGTITTYRLSSPTALGVSPSVGSTTVSVQGHYSFVGSDAPVIDIIEVWNRPTVYFETGQVPAITFNVRGVVQNPDGSTYLERPSAMVVTDENGDNAFKVDLLTDGPTSVPLLGRIHRVRSFTWKLFALPNRLYAGPTDNGPKG